MNSNFWKKIKNKIIEARDESEWINHRNTIEIWEFFLLIIGCYIKEILETFFATANLTNALEYFKTNKEVITAITKLGMGVAFSIYFIAKYKREKLTLCYILTILFSSCIVPAIQMTKWLQIIMFLYPVGILFIFFKIDSTNLDSLKLLIYDNKDLTIYKEENRIFKAPGSQISYKKIGKLLTWSLGILISGIIATKIITSIYIAIKYQGNKPSGTTISGKNQQGLENDIKSGIISAINVLIGAIIFAPLWEEFIFRKCIMKLNNYKWWTVIMSAFIFSLVHLRQESIEKMIPYIAPGIIFAFSMHLKKNIWYTITAHLMHNMIAFISMFVFK